VLEKSIDLLDPFSAHYFSNFLRATLIEACPGISSGNVGFDIKGRRAEASFKLLRESRKRCVVVEGREAGSDAFRQVGGDRRPVSPAYWWIFHLKSSTLSVK
jgi:hypothetical protein